MKFMSILLREGRKEDLKKKYSDKFDEETLDWILNISDLVDFNHKYTDFVLKSVDPEIDASAEFVIVALLPRAGDAARPVEREEERAPRDGAGRVRNEARADLDQRRGRAAGRRGGSCRL